MSNVFGKLKAAFCLLWKLLSVIRTRREFQKKDFDRNEKKWNSIFNAYNVLHVAMQTCNRRNSQGEFYFRWLEFSIIEIEKAA